MPVKSGHDWAGWQAHLGRQPLSDLMTTLTYKAENKHWIYGTVYQNGIWSMWIWLLNILILFKLGSGMHGGINDFILG